MKVEFSGPRLSAAARGRTTESGNLVFPISERAGQALPLRLELRGRQGFLNGRDLSNGSICACLTAEERQNIAFSLRRYIESLLTGEPAPWMSSVHIEWEPHLIGMFGRSSQALLKRMGLDKATRTISVAVLVKDCIKKFSDAMVALALAEMPSWKEGELVDLQVEDGIASNVHRTRQQKFSVQPPKDWAWDGPPGELFKFSSGIAVNRADPRFGWWLTVLVQAHQDKGLNTKGVAIREMASTSLATGGHGLHVIAMALVDGLERASMMTVRQEIEDIARCISRLTRDKARVANIMTTRYGCNGRVRSLEECAKPLGISRQSVFSQLRVCRKLTHNGGWTPALRKLTAEVIRQSGRPLGNVEEDLRTLLGEEQSLQGALSFAKDFFDLSMNTSMSTDQFTTSRELTGIIGRSNVQAYKAVGETIVHGLRGTGFVNKASLLENARSTTSEEMLQDTLDEVVRTLGNIGWSDPSRRWLVIRDKRSQLCSTVWKMLRVAAPGSVSDDDLVYGLRRWMDISGIDPQPSKASLISLCDSLLETIGGCRVQAGTALIDPGDSEVSNIQDEVTVFEIVAGRGGQCGIDVFAAEPERIRQAAAAAPFLVWSQGSVRLVGWTSNTSWGGEAGEGAEKQSKAMFAIDGNVARVTVTQSAATKVRSNDRIVYLPRQAATVIQGEFAHQKRLWPPINVADNRVWRLAGLLTSLGVKAGERIELVFDLKEKTYLLPERG